MPPRSLSVPPFTRTAEIIADNIHDTLAAKTEEVAHLITEGLKKNRKTPINEAKKVVKALYATEGLDDSNRVRLLKIMNKGANEMGDASMLKRVSNADKILTNLSGAVQKSAENYLERIVMPKVARMTLAGKTDEQVHFAITKAMGDAEGYWTNVGNTAASRAYTYGSMIAAKGSGLTRMNYAVVDDEVTTDFCHALIGKSVSLAPAIYKAEVILLQEPDEMLGDDYWDRVRGMSRPTPTLMMKHGLILPPFHGNCRTTTWFS